MRYRARVEVRLKPGHSDPEGETTRQSLQELNYRVESVSVSKIYEIFLDAKKPDDADKMVEDICKRLLANPVKDDYRFEIAEV